MPSAMITTAVLLTSLMMTSMVNCACFKKTLSYAGTRGLGSDRTDLSVFCEYGEERKRLFTAWVDLAACTRCFCGPSGLECCGFGDAPGVQGCVARL